MKRVLPAGNDPATCGLGILAGSSAADDAEAYSVNGRQDRNDSATTRPQPKRGCTGADSGRALPFSDCADNRSRFEAKVSPEPNTGCWLWLGAAVNKQCPYGAFMLAGSQKTVRAHRAAWVIYRGPLPANTLIRHRCDQPMCVNPDHLETGTHIDNMRDAIARGRFRHGVAVGESVNGARLTADAVRRIADLLRSGVSAKAIAPQFGVTKWAICSILQGRTWKHVTGGRLRDTRRRTFCATHGGAA